LAIARLTVAVETPARRATSRIVTERRPRFPASGKVFLVMPCAAPAAATILR
jgi:hypothetical protein